MTTSLASQRTTSLRSVLEKAAGMHTAPVAGTTVLLFGACAAGACGRCPERTTIGERALVCTHDCHNGIDPADFDAAYGDTWYAEVAESE